jgi:hypothetical protein
MTHESDPLDLSPPMDLSPLDPGRDPERWSALLDATRQRVAAALVERGRERDPFDLLSEWARPVLAAAASLLLLLGSAGAILGRGAATPPPTDARQLARLSETAVLRGQPPTGARLAALLRHRGSR